MKTEILQTWPKRPVRSRLVIAAFIFGLLLTSAAYIIYPEAVQRRSLSKAAEEAKEHQHALEKGGDAFFGLNRNPEMHTIAYVSRDPIRSVAGFKAETSEAYPFYRLRGIHPGMRYARPPFYHYPDRELPSANDFHDISRNRVVYDGGNRAHVAAQDERPQAQGDMAHFKNSDWIFYSPSQPHDFQNDRLKSGLLILSAGLLLSIVLFFLTWKLQQIFRIRLTQLRQGKHFEAVFENHVAGVYSLDLQRRVLNANAKFLADLEMDKETLLGLPVEKLIAPEYLALARDKYREASKGTATTYDNVLITGTGKRVHFSIVLMPVSIEGKITGLLGIAKNVTAQRSSERELQESRNTLRLIIDNIPQAVFWKDRESVYLGCNKKLCEEAGLNDPQELIGRTDYDLPWKAQADLYREDDRETMDSGRAKINYEEPYDDIKGAKRWVRVSKVPLTNIDGETIGVLGLAEDITEHRILEKKLVQMAHYDALTDLPNRAYFYDQLGRAIGRSNRHGSLLALIYLDIDKFKLINDTHGHAAGDAVIRMFAQRVKGTIREVDMLGRLGGDEFALIIENLSSRNAAEIVAAKIIEAMRPALNVGELTLQISTSIGVAFHAQGMAGDELIRKADRAMYKAKQSGRNRFEVEGDYHASQAG